MIFGSRLLSTEKVRTRRRRHLAADGKHYTVSVDKHVPSHHTYHFFVGLCKCSVFVLDDGGETDLDLGNYERFLSVR